MTPLRSLLLAALVFASPLLAIADPMVAEGDQRLRENGWTIDTLQITGAERPGVRHLSVRGRFKVPANSVWQAIAYADETAWPGIDQGALEYENGDTTVARYKISIPVFKDRRYRLRVVNNDSTMFEEFHQVPGYGNVHAIDGTWQVEPISDSLTRVDYELDTDPGVKLVPGFIISWATKRMVPGVYEQIYKDALSDATKLGSRHD
jgi:hypothetical protein